jgi:hypothetical protein
MLGSCTAREGVDVPHHLGRDERAEKAEPTRLGDVSRSVARQMVGLLHAAEVGAMVGRADVARAGQELLVWVLGGGGDRGLAQAERGGDDHVGTVGHELIHGGERIGRHELVGHEVAAQVGQLRQRVLPALLVRQRPALVLGHADVNQIGR